MQDALRARVALMLVINELYKNRDGGDMQKMFSYFQKDEEAFRAHVQTWLPSVENFPATTQEKLSMFIMTALYAPTLNTIAHVCMNELKQGEGIQQWQTATASVNTWKLVERSLKERFDMLPEGYVRTHLTPIIANIAQSFSTVLPANRQQH